MRNAGARVMVLREPAGGDPAGPRLVAYCATRVVADEMEVLGLSVEPAWRRRGLGRWLLRQALKRGEGQGARTAFLEVRPSNGAALSLYSSLGFSARGRRSSYYHDPTEDALVLALALGGGPATDPFRDPRNP